MDIDELINRLEQATGPDRELDAEIAITVGAPLRGWYGPHGRWTEGHADYTGSIDAALTLVPDGWSWNVSANENRQHHVTQLGRSYPTNKTVSIYAHTAPICICIAALRAIKASTPTSSGAA